MQKGKFQRTNDPVSSTSKLLERKIKTEPKRLKMYISTNSNVWVLLDLNNSFKNMVIFETGSFPVAQR